ncbi:DDE-type integrase/transposase/recombinase [Vibrio maritimus]|uniref:DDE-type integrase/transposase/recombinase n=1 Tax=Vibrio maritimus TaxID=990268 RepID=UPI004068D519
MGEKTYNLPKHNPKHVLVSDVTYRQSAGVHYLSLVSGAFNRKVMKYELNNAMKQGDVVKVLDIAIKIRQYQCSSVHHTGRRIQYCSSAYGVKLKMGDIRPSMTDG